MDKNHFIFGKKEFGVFLFFLFWIIFNWPFVTIFDLENPKIIFGALFIIWGFAIGVLFFISLFHRKHQSSETEKESIK